MTILVEFPDVAGLNRLIRLAGEEIASLVGREVLAEERIEAGERLCTASQWKRAKTAVNALPEQIKTMEDARRAMVTAVNEARRREGAVA